MKYSRLPNALIMVVLLLATLSMRVANAVVAATNRYDVVVVGAGEAGVAAAIQAARLGMNVALLEETDWIGGMMTMAGVTCMDGNRGWHGSGVYVEFTSHVKDYYIERGRKDGQQRFSKWAPEGQNQAFDFGTLLRWFGGVLLGRKYPEIKPTSQLPLEISEQGQAVVGTCYYASNTFAFEPHVGKLVLERMINEANGTSGNIDLHLRTYPTEVLMSEDGHIVRGVKTQSGDSFLGKVTIDATEYGDVIALSPARYRAGNSTSDALNPGACVQDITYTAVMKKYPLERYPDGVPEGLFLDSKPPGYDDVRNIFASVVKTNGHDWEDGDYGAHLPHPWTWAYHNAFRGMPDSSNPEFYTAAYPDALSITKTGINRANDHPYSVWSLDRANRKGVNCDAKLFTLNFLYYVQHGLGETEWAIANDEGYDTTYNTEENSCSNIPESFKELEKHFPLVPYVRESRRLVGMYTLTAKDIMRVGNPSYKHAQKSFSTSLAVGDWAIDLHGCATEDMLESDLGETLHDIPDGNAHGVFQIPFESFVPERIDGLLAAGKLISTSRLANGATRHQPVSLMTGQAAGAIAAVAIQQGKQPRRLYPHAVEDVQRVLLDANAMLVPLSDAGPGDTYFKSVQLVALKGIMVGDSNLRFGSNDPLKREQMAVALTEMLDLSTESVPDTPSFNDVPTAHWAYPYVEAIYRKGLISGCGQGNFCPNKAVTRAQAAMFLMRAWEELDPSKQLIMSDTPTYQDVPSVHWAYTFVESLSHYGVDMSCSTNPRKFCPNKAITRAEVTPWIATILEQLTALDFIMVGFRRDDPLLREDMAVVLRRMLDPPTSGAPSFSDVPTAHWAYAYVEAIYRKGLTSGCGQGNFCPNKAVTRAQAAVFLMRAWQELDPSKQLITPATPTYLDVPPSHGAYKFVESLSHYGVDMSCSTNPRKFCPNKAVTRAEVTSWIATILGQQPIPREDMLREDMAVALTEMLDLSTESVSDMPSFSDVPIDHWAYPYVEAIYRKGLTSGCGRGNFCPNKAVTRAQAAVFLMRAWQELDPSKQLIMADTSTYLDFPSVHWAYTFVESLSHYGVDMSCSTSPRKFCPNKAVTRAEVTSWIATILGQPILREDMLREDMAAVLTEMLDLSTESVPDTPSFNDVPTAHWAYPYVEAIYRKGLISGCGQGNFCPNKAVTRAQAAVFLMRAWQELDPSKQLITPATPTYLDFPSVHWAYTFVESLSHYGVDMSCSTNPRKFCPNKAVTRAEVTSWIATILGQQPILREDMLREDMAVALTRMLDLLTEPTPSFSDVPTDHWAYPYVEAIYRKGLTSGCGQGNFCPNKAVTRAQAAMFLMRAWQELDPSKQLIMSDTPTYQDVPSSYGAYTFVESLSHYGVDMSCSTNPRKFCPNKAVTRAEVTPWIATVLDLD